LVELGGYNTGRTPNQPAFAYRIVQQSVFDEVYVHPSFVLLESEWAKAFVRLTYRLVAVDGHLHVHRRVACSEAAASWLHDHLSSIGDVRIESDWLTLVRSVNVPHAADSVAEWFFAHAPEVLETSVKEYLGRAVISTRGTGLATHDSEYERISRQQTDNMGYFLGGLAYKAPVVRNIIKALLPDGRDLTVIDMGGGPGFLGFELALDPELNVHSVTALDINRVNVAIGHLVGNAMAQLRGRFDFVQASIDSFAFGRSYDVVMFIGVLCVIPAAGIGSSLRRAWQALRAGGLLIVQENMRAPGSAAGSPYVFSPDELDALLNEFGEVRYFHVHRASAISKHAAGCDPVFRVVQKGRADSPRASRCGAHDGDIWR
jgi:SAM-dependent methyltransferase